MYIKDEGKILSGRVEADMRPQITLYYIALLRLSIHKCVLVLRDSFRLAARSAYRYSDDRERGKDRKRKISAKMYIQKYEKVIHADPLVQFVLLSISLLLILLGGSFISA